MHAIDHGDTSSTHEESKQRSHLSPNDRLKRPLIFETGVYFTLKSKQGALTFSLFSLSYPISSSKLDIENKQTKKTGERKTIVRYLCGDIQLSDTLCLVRMLLRLVDAVVIPMSLAVVGRLAWDMLVIDPYMVRFVYLSTD
jgi:hypothetical protein